VTDSGGPGGPGVPDSPVILYDTTLRDGTQGENITLSLADKLRVARMLDEFGMPFVEGGWPGSNPKDIEFFAAARTMRWERAKLAAFGSTRHRSNKPGDDPNLRELVAAETPVVTIFGKSWLLHVIEVLGASPDENLDMIADSIGFVADRGREAVYDAEHFFDGYRADRGYALDTLRAARQAGARTLVLCDTNGGTLTNELVAIIGDVRGTLDADPDAPGVTWGIHTHNDADLAVANSMAAVAAGIRHVQATINGYGERAGNANMVSILANLALKTPHALVPAGGGDLPGLTELSRSVAEIANITPNDYQPYVGRSAFAHKGGVHGAAVAKVERSYQHIDPTAVGNVGRLVVSELGGRANLSIRAEQLGHQLEGVVDPRELSKLIKQLEADGLAFEGAEASFELLIRRHAADYVAPFRIVDYTCLVEQRDGREMLAEATVKVEVDGETLHTAADGNGPVNALDAALRKALSAFYPGIDEVHLVDYKVRILDGGAATAARTRVVIDSMDGARTWSTMGSDTNIIAASASALADSLEYAIWKSGSELRRRDERQFTRNPARDAASTTPAARGATATPRR
jgi:2-isopropylmalate synthase